MEQVFVDKIQSMIVESKTITQIVKTLFNIGCPDSASDILDIASQEEEKMDAYMAEMLGKST